MRTTRSNAKYVKEWRAFADAVVAAFPGYERYAYDPGVTLRKEGRYLSLDLYEAHQIYQLVKGQAWGGL